jgi:hypothetical protein
VCLCFPNAPTIPRTKSSRNEIELFVCRNFSYHRLFSLKLCNRTIIAVQIGSTNKKWGVPASSGSYGQKCDVFWSVFIRLLTWLWNNVWVGVCSGLENDPSSSWVSAVEVGGGVTLCAAVSLSWQTLDGRSLTMKDWDGPESGAHCESTTATVRRCDLMCVLCVVVGNTEFALS